MFRIKTIALTFVIALIATNAFACSIFTASKNSVILAGNNEDMIDPDTNVWFIPAADGLFGRAYFGFDVGFPQGGMNDQGLFFDCAATKPHMFKHSSEREEYEGNVFEKMLGECVTVDDALEIVGNYDLSHMFRFQVLIADKSGDAAIIEGETVIRKDGDHLVLTNFRQSLNEENPFSLDRFTTADSMLKESTTISVELFQSVLAATCQTKDSPTQYSTVLDLNSGEMHINLFQNYDDTVTLNIHNELAKGAHSIEIASLFEKPNDAYEAFKAKAVFEERIPGTADPSVYPILSGIYEVMPSLRFTISEENDKLYGRMHGFARYELIPAGESKYFFREMKASFTFVKNDSGNVESLVFNMYGQEMPAKKIQ